MKARRSLLHGLSQSTIPSLAAGGPGGQHALLLPLSDRSTQRLLRWQARQCDYKARRPICWLIKPGLRQGRVQSGKHSTSPVRPLRAHAVRAFSGVESLEHIRKNLTPVGRSSLHIVPG